MLTLLNKDNIYAGVYTKLTKSEIAFYSTLLSASRYQFLAEIVWFLIFNNMCMLFVYTAVPIPSRLSSPLNHGRRQCEEF